MSNLERQAPSRDVQSSPVFGSRLLLLQNPPVRLICGVAVLSTECATSIYLACMRFDGLLRRSYLIVVESSVAEAGASGNNFRTICFSYLVIFHL